MAVLLETFATSVPATHTKVFSERSHSCCKARSSLRSLVPAANSRLSNFEVPQRSTLSSALVKGRKNKEVVRASASTPESSNGKSPGETKRTAVVWFKRDLRIDDHPGLAAASHYSHVIPLFVFDSALLSGLSDDLVCSLQDAVSDLRRSLQGIASDLIIRTGRTADVLLGIANEVGALDIITEKEIEVELQKLVGVVSASLSVETIAGQDMKVKQWRSSLYDIQSYEELPDCYKKFQASGLSVGCPLEPPSRLPPLPRNLQRGSLPAPEEVIHAVASAASKSELWEEFKEAQNLSPEEALGVNTSLERGTSNDSVAQTSNGIFKELAAWREKYILANPYEAVEKKRRETGGEIEEENSKECLVRGGATGALESFQGYLRFQEPTSRADWQELHEQVMDLEKRPGSSFRALFGNSLALGTLSLRRIYYEAIEYEKARGGGWLSPFGFSSRTAEAAINDTKAIDWYQLLAHKSREQGRDNGYQIGTWRWKGYLIQYAVAGETGPPMVFVHGFGAFWDHFRDNLKPVAEAGNRVWALTLLGFGRSEKPRITYTDLVWAELVRDFVVEVVQEPVILAGNSIGGYTVSVVAGLWPALVKSLVLFNSAGRVIPDYKSIQYRKPKEKSYVAYAGARVLLSYLQNLSNGMLTKCYPTNPERADDWLQTEVMRASHDPNSTAVLEAMFLLRAPLPLNYYIDRFDGNVLIVQGMRDPLHNSSLRASMLQAYCKNVSINYVNAGVLSNFPIPSGHCPHDEVPEEVNSILISWLRSSFSLPSAGEGVNAEGSKLWLRNAEVAAAIEKEAEEERNHPTIDPITRMKEEMEELV